MTSLEMKAVKQSQGKHVKMDRSMKRQLEGFDDDKDNKKHRRESILDDINHECVDTRIKIHVLKTPGKCLHEVAVYPSHEYIPLAQSSKTPAKKFSFILDPFQKEAILCIENNQSVLVSAHTSAGKTVVAEYAIALVLGKKQRVIYTTPIKALSNQKYREFQEEFKDVGLITGDIIINPSASCLIMTTEILRDMLYRGSEIVREVGWIIFDEIHYMRDKKRGVVWEETLILIPNNIRFVFLSATIPNARQFAEWICFLHKEPCHVVYTDYRPTPLQHYIFPSGGNGIHLVIDEKGNFKEDNFKTAMKVPMKADEIINRGRKGVKVTNRDSGISKIVKMIMERNLAPAIIFSFSKKECESNAHQMKQMDFNSIEEKKLVDEVFNNAMNALNADDKKLPQVKTLLPLLRRGIGIHHSGLLPILKETIEILFGEGLLKVLFSTETFAMGLNMPARTVVFTSSHKFDGGVFRELTSSEYVQMSGRAGRRGLDDKGIVILMIDEKDSPNVIRKIIHASPTAINSSFRLTSKMILNLLRVEGISPEFMIERSFLQFQNQSKIPKLEMEVNEKIDQLKLMEIYKHHGVHQLSSAFSRFQLEEHLKQSKLALQEAKSLVLQDELKSQIRVLQRLGFYCPIDDLIEFKGLVACQMSADGNELLLTEMIFNNFFYDLTPQQSAALLSCFVCDDYVERNFSRGPQVRRPLMMLQEEAIKFAKVLKQCEIKVDEKRYAEKFKPTLMDVIFAWCEGKSFAEICKMTNVNEGNIVRTIRQLEDLLRQMVQAAKKVGDFELENKFSEAIRLLKRDIVKTSSIYY